MCGGFTYNGINFEEEYDVIRVMFDTIDEEDVGLKIKVLSDKLEGSSERTEYGYDYEDVLSFEFYIIHSDGRIFTTEEIREIMKQLTTRKECAWLSFNDCEEDISYHCRCIDIQKKYSTGVIGFRVKFECDSNYAYSSIITKTFTSTGITTNNIVECDTDVIDEYVLPELVTITSTSSNSVCTIVNTSDKGRVLSITNMSSGEVVTIDKNNVLTTTSAIALMDRVASFGFVRLLYGTNNYTLSGNFTLEIQYRLPRKVGLIW